MNILWLCNMATPDIAKKMGQKASSLGGWLAGAASALAQIQDIQLHICFPQSFSSEIVEGETGNVRFYGFPAPQKPPHIYEPATEQWLAQVLQRAKPDVLHIWGTELPHTLAMTRAFHQPQKTVISIQGLCDYIAQHYRAYLPERACTAWTIRDFLRHDRIADQQKKFRQRGLLGAQALKNTGYIIGRTRWDRACTAQTAPGAAYRFCNETLRGAFYENAGAWSAESCEKHSIFVSQASYPLKGFHMVLAAMPEILRRYPDAKLYTTGGDPFAVPFYRINGYQRWLKKQITKLGLRQRVQFLGDLDERTMCARYLKSHVFVSASSIENSPNSVGEAMLLGVPTVASYVGGTMDLLAEGKEGFLYQPDAPYMLADRVCAFFADDALAAQMGAAASSHARLTHDPQKNLETLLHIYKEIFES